MLFPISREVFSKLTAEEVEAGWSEENEEDIPSFGDSQSLYDDVSTNCITFPCQDLFNIEMC